MREVAELARQELNVSCEVIDLVTILPWDQQTVFEVRKEMCYMGDQSFQVLGGLKGLYFFHWWFNYRGHINNTAPFDCLPYISTLHNVLQRSLFLMSVSFMSSCSYFSSFFSASLLQLFQFCLCKGSQLSFFTYLCFMLSWMLDPWSWSQPAEFLS